MDKQIPNVPLPPEDVVAMTILSGRNPCVLCGEPAEPGRITCGKKECDAIWFIVDRWRNANDKPVWFKRTCYEGGRPNG